MLITAPKEFASYISVGTVADFAKADKLKYEFLKKKVRNSNDTESTAALRKLGAPPYKRFEQLTLLSGLLWKYGGSFKTYTIKDINAAVQKNREYSEHELEQQGVGMEKTYPFYAEFLNNYKAINLAKQIRIPVIFVHGRYDMATPINLTKSYYDSLDSPAGKKWIVFDNSAHFPMYEEPLKFLEVLHQAAGI